MDIVRKWYPDHELFGAKRDRMFDQVCGTDLIRKAFLEGESIGEILKIWREGVEGFRSQRAKYLLYR